MNRDTTTKRWNMSSRGWNPRNVNHGPSSATPEGLNRVRTAHQLFDCSAPSGPAAFPVRDRGFYPRHFMSLPFGEQEPQQHDENLTHLHQLLNFKTSISLVQPEERHFLARCACLPCDRERQHLFSELRASSAGKCRQGRRRYLVYNLKLRDLWAKTG